jgi:integrase
MNDLIPQSIRNGMERVTKFYEADWSELLKILYGAGWAQSTYSNVLSAVRTFFDEWSRTQNRERKPLHPAEITMAHVEQFFDWHSRKSKVQSTVTKVRQIAAFFRRLEVKFPFFQSPFSTMTDALRKKLAGPSADTRRRHFPNSTEINRIFDYLKAKRTMRDYYTYCLCRTLFVHGFRIGELYQMRWTDITEDHDRSIIHFIGKGNRQESQELHADVLAEIRQLRDYMHYTGSYLFMSPPNVSYNRIKLHGKRFETEDARCLMGYLTREVNEMRLLDFEVRITPHFWRHCCGTYLSDELRWPVQAIAKYLRHKSIEVTAGYYCNENPISPMEAFPRGPVQ